MTNHERGHVRREHLRKDDSVTRQGWSQPTLSIHTEVVSFIASRQKFRLKGIAQFSSLTPCTELTLLTAVDLSKIEYAPAGENDPLRLVLLLPQMILQPEREDTGQLLG